MNKVKQVSRIVLSIAVGLCFALGAWLLIPFGIKNASADAGASAIEADTEDSWLDNGAAFIVGSQSAKMKEIRYIGVGKNPKLLLTPVSRPLREIRWSTLLRARASTRS